MVGRKTDWTKYIGYIISVIVILGAVYESGRKSGKIEILNLRITQVEDENKEQEDFIKAQLVINGGLLELAKRGIGD